VTWRSRLPASIATWFSRDLVAPALALLGEGRVTLESVDDDRIVAVVRSSGSAPKVAIEWAGGTGPQGLRPVCACGGSGVCSHVVAALEAVRTHVIACEDAASGAEDAALDWLPPPSAGTQRRARKIWPVFSSPDGATLACSLFLDTPRLRGVVREGETVAAMLEQTPPDDWDEFDRSLLRDALLRDAFAARANPRALAQIMFRLARHPRLRFDDRPAQHRHPEELLAFAIDGRGVSLFARIRGAQPVPYLLTMEGRELNLRRALLLDGPPAWIADAAGAYLLDGTLDISRAARAIAAARSGEDGDPNAQPSVETLARVAGYLPSSERERFGVEDATDTVARLHITWRKGVLLVRPRLHDRVSGTSIDAGSTSTIASTGSRLVRFAPELLRGLVDRLSAAGFVPRLDTDHPTFGLHGAERAAAFVCATLPDWSDVEVELDDSASSVQVSQRVKLELSARRDGAREDWFELDVDVSIGDEEPLNRDELAAILRGAGRYADVRGRLVDVRALREREALLRELLEHRKSGMAALVALRDEIHAAFTDVRLPEEVEALRERVRGFSGIPQVEPPAALAETLREYQKRGLDFLEYLSEFRFGGILADDMGTGKTLEAIAHIDRRREKDGTAPSLVIAPTSVVHTWEIEISRFAPHLRVLRLESGNGRASRYDDLERFDVVITSYALARIDAEKLASIHFRTVILDEAQNAKNPSSQISKVVRSLQASHRFALTGTPVENSLRDLWAIFAFLEPGLLGSASSFRERFELPIAAGDATAASRLRARLEPFLLRRTKEDVAPELPERTETDIVVDLSPAQRKLYRAIVEAARRDILEGWDEGSPQEPLRVLAALTRLRQVCAHPGLLSKSYAALPESSAKFEALCETIDEILSGEHKVLVFSAFASMLHLIRDELTRREIPFGYLDGSVKDRDRRQQVAAFMKEGGPPVFLCSLKAGGVGLTLTAADYVILYDPWWNPAAERQAIDRTHRIGQRRPVTAYRLIARGTVEEKIRALAVRKRALSEAVIRADATMAKTLNREDLEFLLSEPD
jgi:superfamily II DNA or RNA helicase